MSALQHAQHFVITSNRCDATTSQPIDFFLSYALSGEAEAAASATTLRTRSMSAGLT